MVVFLCSVYYLKLEVPIEYVYKSWEVWYYITFNSLFRFFECSDKKVDNDDNYLHRNIPELLVFFA